MRVLKILLIACLLTTVACGEDSGVSDEDTNPEGCMGGKCDVIGEDDRRDEWQDDVSDELKLYARSTAMIIDNSSLISKRTRTTIVSEALGDAYMMCEDEPFRDQPTSGFCTAWLVAPDVMITNGHCITSQQACESSSFVFDHTYTTEGRDLSDASMNDVYACERVLAWDYTRDCDVDFAVVKLVRKVEDREPLKVRPSAAELDSENLVIIGHPFGLPRKYAVKGNVVNVGSNAFTTTHDIFGGNSGSGIIDAITGEVQGLVTCGGSNLEWEYINTGWELERKTGQACDATCDSEGFYGAGTWEDCDAENKRRRCVCDADGSQLVWEKRACLPFEADSGGQCARESHHEQSTCENTPWLCATPLSQHTAHFVHYATDWEVFSSRAAVPIPADRSAESVIEVDAAGVAQAFSVYLDFVGNKDLMEVDLDSPFYDLDISIEHDGIEYDLVLDGQAFNGTTFNVIDSPAAINPFQVPFVMHGQQMLEVGGTWTLKISNAPNQAFTLYGWSIQTAAKPENEVTELGLPACSTDCIMSYEESPEPVLENFEGSHHDVDDALLQGTLAEGWEFEILDQQGTDYEVTKTRKSQTMSLSKGEFAIFRDFGEEIGGRMLSVDYRYDGDGWFQVWANDHILISHQGFAQSYDSIALPLGSHSVRIVVGATDDSQFHEATLYSVELSGGLAAEPASCNGVLGCVQACGEDPDCQQACIDAGSADAQTLYWDFNECATNNCQGITDVTEFNDCLQTYCVTPMNSCLTQ